MHMQIYTVILSGRKIRINVGHQTQKLMTESSNVSTFFDKY